MYVATSNFTIMKTYEIVFIIRIWCYEIVRDIIPAIKINVKEIKSRAKV